ncbi:MAG: choice-of-anchor J domain-containing protein [Chloroflexota bacterium]
MQEHRDYSWTKWLAHGTRTRDIGVRVLMTGLTTLVIIALLIASIGAFGLSSIHAQTCNELLTDGGFETDGNWSATSAGNYQLLSDYRVRSGVQAAYLGGVDSAQDTLSTVLSIPADTDATFSFWWQVESEESSSDWDGMSVILADLAGTQLQTLLSVSDANATDDQNPTWTQATIDLSAYAGQTVQIQFVVQTDSSLVTDFFVDDASLMSCTRATEPDTSEPVTNEPDTTEPDTTEPDTTEPDTTEPDTSEPDTTEPDTTEPDTSEPVTNEPDTTEPDTSEPVTNEPNTPDETQTEVPATDPPAEETNTGLNTIYLPIIDNE